VASVLGAKRGYETLQGVLGMKTMRAGAALVEPSSIGAWLWNRRAAATMFAPGK
jgi:hypothetical protein